MTEPLPIRPRAPTPRAHPPYGNPYPDADGRQHARAYSTRPARWLHALRDQIPADVMPRQEVDRIVAILLAQLNHPFFNASRGMALFYTHLRDWHRSAEWLQYEDEGWTAEEERLRAQMQLPRITQEDEERHARAAQLYQDALAEHQREHLDLTTRRDDSKRDFIQQLQMPHVIARFEQLNDELYNEGYVPDLTEQIVIVRTYTRKTSPMKDNPGVPVFRYLAQPLIDADTFCMYATPEAVETFFRALLDTLQALRKPITRGLFRGGETLFAEQLRSITHNYDRAARTRYPLCAPIYVRDPTRHSPLSYARYQFIVDHVRQYAGTAGKRALCREALYALVAVSRADPDDCPFACLTGCKDILLRIVAFAYEA